MKWYIQVLRNYATFHGRARRKEFWMFFLFNTIIIAALAITEGIVGTAPEKNQSVLVTIYELAVLVPNIAVGVRRMHDTDHSGWWWLFPFVNLVFAALDGQKGANRFGPDPKLATPEGVGVEARVMSPTDSNFIVCSRCGFEQWKGYGTCQKCGVAFEKIVPPTAPSAPAVARQSNVQVEHQTLIAFCIRCGTKFPETAAYCPKCGAARTV